MKKPNIIIAGDAVYAGIDSDDCAEIPNAVVIQFDSKEQMLEVIAAGTMEFDMLRNDEK